MIPHRLYWRRTCIDVWSDQPRHETCDRVNNGRGSLTCFMISPFPPCCLYHHLFLPPCAWKYLKKSVTSSYKQNNVDKVTVKCTNYYFRKLYLIAYIKSVNLKHCFWTLYNGEFMPLYRLMRPSWNFVSSCFRVLENLIFHFHY